MINDLIKLANDLDAAGLEKEADTLDSIIKEAAACGFLMILGAQFIACGAPDSSDHVFWWYEPGKGIATNTNLVGEMEYCARDELNGYVRISLDISHLIPGESLVKNNSTTCDSPRDCERRLKSAIDSLHDDRITNTDYDLVTEDQVASGEYVIWVAYTKDENGNFIDVSASGFAEGQKPMSCKNSDEIGYQGD